MNKFILMKISTFVFLITLLLSCKKECLKNIEFTGIITDTNNLPIQDVQVYLIERDGSQSLLGITNSDGLYSITLENKISIGGLHTSFKKDGYLEVNTANNPIENSSSSCDKQSVNRNIVMTLASI